jgi:hypothetical protein
MVGYGNLNDAAVDQAIAALAEIVRRSRPRLYGSLMEP